MLHRHMFGHIARIQHKEPVWCRSMGVWGYGRTLLPHSHTPILPYFLAPILILVLAANMANAADTTPEKGAVPLAVGNRWEYSVTQTGVMSVSEGDKSRSAQMSTTGTCVEEVTGVKERRPNGDVVYVDVLTTKMEKGINAAASESTVESLLMRSKDGIYILGSKSSGMDGLLSNQWVNYNPPLAMYGSGLKTGKKWKIGTVREGKLTMPMYAQVAGIESITVPAGTFDDCLKIHITCNKVRGTMGSGSDTAEITDGKSITTIWIAPGVGVVKEDNILQAKMEFPPDDKGRVFTMTGTQRKIKELQPGFRADAE